MKRDRYREWYLKFACLICGLLACGLTAHAENSKKEITVLAYICGSNLESDTGAASRDLKEIMRSGYDSDKVNVIAMTGGSTKWWSGFNTEETAIYDLAGKRPSKVYSDGLRNMGESGTLTEFLDFGYRNYPAERYALILWNHGAGPLGGVCLDYLSNGDTLDMQELTTALSESFTAHEKLDWIGFDACLMSSIETACLLEPYANYMISSQETEPGEGWNYHFLKSIHEDQNGEETGKKIIDAYFSGSDNEGKTLSCIDLTQTDALCEKMNTFFIKAAKGLDQDSFPMFSSTLQEVKSLGRIGDDNQSYDLVDLYNLVEHYADQDWESADDFLQSMKSAVCYNRSGQDGCNGLSVYHPYYNKQRYQNGWREQYQLLKICTGYSWYLHRFSAIWLGEELTEWGDFADTDMTVEVTENQESTISLQLSEEQAEQYITGQVVVLEENEDGYHQVLSSDDVSLTEEGDLVANFSIQKLYVYDEKGSVLAGPVTYDILEGVYQIDACTLNIAQQQLSKIRILCSPLEEDPMQLRIDSIMVYDNLLESYTSRLDINWMEYDCIFFPDYYREQTYDDVLLAYRDWELTGFSMKENIFIGVDWHFKLVDGDAGDEYYATVQITDTQVNTLSSEPVLIE